MSNNIRPIVTAPQEIRDAIHNSIKQSISSKFPMDTPKYSIALENIKFSPIELTHDEQSDVLMAKGNSSDALYGDLILTDKGTGGKITIPKHRIINVPYYTNRYTMIVDGNEYSIVSQMRTKPGVYTRKRGNDDLESSFNLAKGANFRLLMAPATGVFKISISNSTIPAFALLKILGAPTVDIKSVLGEELFLKNESVTTKSQLSRARTLLFSKLVKSELGDRATDAEKDAKIREYFSSTEIDPETTRLTLGTAYSNVNYRIILDAMVKILQVFNEEGDVDERDNVEFQKIYTVEDILKEVLDKNNDALYKIKNKLSTYKPTGDERQDRKDIKAIFSPVYFTKPLRNFITTSSISRLPSQINPMEIMDSACIVTRLGEGAIASEDAIPDETRQVNYSYLGVIDPIATPESSKVGIDNRVTMQALKGEDNEFYKYVVNMKTNKHEKVKAISLYDKYVGFPEPGHNKALDPTEIVPAVYKSKMVKVPRHQLDYRYPSGSSMLTVSSSSVPFINAIQGNRAVMGDKHVQQALPLVEPEKRLVTAVSSAVDIKSGEAFKIRSTEYIGQYLLPKSPVDGEVVKIDSPFIFIRDNSGEIHKVEFVTNLPLATKTLLTNEVKVKVGDKVTKNQILADSNFTKGKDLAMGRNLRVAYMPYYGQNHEDGTVISESAAKKLTSVHADKVTLHRNALTVLDKGKYKKYFPTNFSNSQLNKLDDLGVVKEGTILENGDPIIVAMEDDSESRKNLILGLLHKSLISPFRDISEVYELAYPAEVLKVQKTASIVNVLLKINKPMAVGDKLAGSYGNKGVVTKIVPDDQMPHDEAGKPVEVLLTPVGVIGRINPAQILESALGKVALKTGKPYDVENFGEKDYTEFVAGELKKHGVRDKEDLIDPVTGKKLANVFVGIQHMHKLFKTTDTNFAARGVDGPHDGDDSPTGSGDDGPKALGGMEVNALLAHNARTLLHESTMLRGAKNTDYWRAFQSGYLPNMPTEKKTFTRFTAILKQAGIKLEKKDTTLALGPLTDHDILLESSGEIADGKMLSSKNLAPEEGGLFDPAKTGGLEGTRWTHVKLTEPVVNPVFEDCVKSLLGYSTKEFLEAYRKEGGEGLKKKLNAIKVDSEISIMEKALEGSDLSGANLDKVVKKLKYLKALKAQGLKAGDAYVLTVFPVTPPVFRPISVGKTGDTMANDSNKFYQDLILLNNSFDSVKKGLNIQEDVEANREALYSRLKEITGVIAPSSVQNKNRGLKGALDFISGDSPKHGFFQRKVIYGKMNLSGRATIVPDKDLDLDEVGLPEKMAWSLYKPFIVREMVQMGYSALDARDHIEDHSETAKKIMLDQMEKRPVIFNRAPTLHRHNIVALKPRLRDSKNLHINSIIEKGLNADYDGDACTVHLPVTDEAVAEAKDLFPSKLVFTDKKPNDVIQIPTNEPIVGLYRATENVGKAVPTGVKIKKYPNVESAWKDYYAGNLKMTDYVEIAS